MQFGLSQLQSFSFMSNNNTLLIIGLVWPEPGSSAAGTRMIQLINLFVSNNFNVVFASVAQPSDHSVDMASIGATQHTIELNSDSFDIFIREQNPNFVVFDRFVIEEQFGWRVSTHCPHAIKILDTEDLHCIRIARQLALKAGVACDNTFIAAQDVAKREIASIYRCDLSLIISMYEMALLKSLFKIDSTLLMYLPLFYESLKVELPSFASRLGFMFIGNFHHEPNRDAVVYLKEILWPLIRAKTAADIYIYGAYMPNHIITYNNPSQGFHILGRAESSAKVLRQARVMLAPLHFGAGLKGKLLEAMQNGTASVTTQVGAEGIASADDWNGAIEDDPARFAASAVNLYHDEVAWNKAQQNGYKILESRFRSEDFIKGFLQRLSELQETLRQHRQNNFIGSMLQYHTMRSTEFMSRWIEAKNK